MHWGDRWQRRWPHALPTSAVTEWTARTPDGKSDVASVMGLGTKSLAGRWASGRERRREGEEEGALPQAPAWPSLLGGGSLRSWSLPAEV